MNTSTRWLVGLTATIFAIVGIFIFGQLVGLDTLAPLIGIAAVFIGAAVWLYRKFPGRTPTFLTIKRHRVATAVVAVVFAAGLSTVYVLAKRQPESSITLTAAQVRYGQNAYSAFAQPIDLSKDDLVVSDPKQSGKGPDAWFKTVKPEGAVSLGKTQVQVVMSSTKDPIQVQDVTIRQLVRTDPLSGTLVCARSEGASDVISMYFDGDEVDPVPNTYVLGQAAPQLVPYFSQQHLDLKKDEGVTLGIEVSATSYYEEFVIDVTYKENGQTRVATVDDSGQPFKVTGRADKSKDSDPTLPGMPMYKTAYAYLLGGPNSGQLAKVDPATFKNTPSDVTQPICS